MVVLARSSDIYNNVNSNVNNYANSEIIRKLAKTDNYSLFMALMCVINIPLLNSINDEKIDNIKKELEENSQNDNEEYTKDALFKEIVNKLIEDKLNNI